jgi:L,D-transpeptidase YcbB
VSGYNRVETSPIRRFHVHVLAVLFLVLGVPAYARADSTSDAIRAIVAQARLDGLRIADFSRDQYLVELLYEPVDYGPLWLDDDEPSDGARDAIAVLRAVDAKGLRATDYDADTLAAQADRLEDGRHSGLELARFDVALTVAAVRLVSDLHVGRVDAKALGFDYGLDAKRDELPPLLHEAALGARLRDVAEHAAPQFTERGLLEQQLAHYRQLAADSAVVPVRVPVLRPGDPFRAAPRLAAWLTALGDLAPGARVPKSYAGVLVEAVQRFQLRHGLRPDGIIGESTGNALAVPAAERARQIELALERLRWLPALPPDRGLFVNVPAFELWAFDELGSGRPPTLQMSVVVGRALGTQTPFLTGTMTTVVFAPYWNVPESIIRKEILPKASADPGYLASQEMEIVSGGVVLAATSDALTRLAHGEARLRQRPGPHNALGRVKFLFPNAEQVYMHDTPSRRLFQRTRRDFSHGCIRLADAAALAHWVLEGDGSDAARVDELLGVARQKTVSLRQPIPVIIGYATAVARLDGTVAFYDDIYGHDVALERALNDASLAAPRSDARGAAVSGDARGTAPAGDAGAAGAPRGPSATEP